MSKNTNQFYTINNDDDVIRGIVKFSINTKAGDNQLIDINESMVDDNFISDWIKAFREQFKYFFQKETFGDENGFFEVGEVDLMDFCNSVRLSAIEKIMMDLVDSGLVAFGYSEEKNDFVFWLTEKGRNALFTD